jgi:hypothetical protein
MAEGIELDAHHLATVEKIFNHPVSHNIQWHDVLSLLHSVAHVKEEADGRPKRSTPLGITISTSNR